MKEAFKNATGYEIPSLYERAASKYSLVLDQNSMASVIAYNRFLSQCVTDCLLCYTETAKTAAPNMIVGGYNGYLWFENSSLGIGTSHTTAQQVLSSEYIDFVCSPVNYSERINGFATGYMTMTDSISSYGKLYIAEQDNRTLYGHIFGKAQSDNAVGLCNTLYDSVNQITRDLSTDLISGSGFWLYDMEGGWFDDLQIRSAVKTLKNEYDYSQSLNMSSNSEVALFVGDDTYDYLNSDIYLSDFGSRSTRLLSQLYTAQRLELSKMGTSYDTFAVSDLVSEKSQVDWSQYKLVIMLSPFRLSGDERLAIDEKFKRDGKYILWVYLPGISNGITSSASNISSLVDMEVTVDSGSGNTLYAQISDFCIAVPSKDAAIYDIKILLQEATDETAFHIGNITMCENDGDLNFDGLVSSEDLAVMRKALLGIERKTEFMDLNGDMNIEISDLIRQKKYCVVK